MDDIPIGGMKMNENAGGIDEQPIGKSNNGFTMTEFPDGEEQPPA